MVALATGIFFLILDVLLDDGQRRTATRHQEVRSVPQHGLAVYSRQLTGEFLSEQP